MEYGHPMNLLNTKHINHCWDNGHTDMFEHSVQDLVTWMSHHYTDHRINTHHRNILLRRGEVTMTDCLTLPSAFTLLAEYQDKLGWDNFLEGRITSLVEEQRLHTK